jgi:hypothetical protein
MWAVPLAQGGRAGGLPRPAEQSQQSKSTEQLARSGPAGPTSRDTIQPARLCHTASWLGKQSRHAFSGAAAGQQSRNSTTLA